MSTSWVEVVESARWSLMAETTAATVDGTSGKVLGLERIGVIVTAGVPELMFSMELRGVEVRALDLCLAVVLANSSLESKELAVALE